MKSITELLLEWFKRVLEDKAHGYKARIEHDWNCIAAALLDGQGFRLKGFCPKVQCPEFDDLKEAILKQESETDLRFRPVGDETNPDPLNKFEVEEGRSRNFFTGELIAKNPLTPNGCFGTPRSMEALLDRIELFNGGERIAAMTSAMMAINLCHKLVKSELEGVEFEDSRTRVLQ
jgi:hypothetical protein